MLKYAQVVQNGRKVQVNIVKTEEKGWGKKESPSSISLLILGIGVFAGQSMEAGTFLGIYSGELITEAIGESRR
jgi:histone-lysine N-methyltransferase SUV39H